MFHSDGTALQMLSLATRPIFADISEEKVARGIELTTAAKNTYKYITCIGKLNENSRSDLHNTQLTRSGVKFGLH